MVKNANSDICHNGSGSISWDVLRRDISNVDMVNESVRVFI